MTIKTSGTGFLAVQPLRQGDKSANVAGWGSTRIAAMEACEELLAAMERLCSR